MVPASLPVLESAPDLGPPPFPGSSLGSTPAPDSPAAHLWELREGLRVQLEAGDARGALAALGRLSSAEERCFGPNHPTLGRTLASTAEALLELGEERAAEPLLRRARAIYECALGLEHPDLLEVRLHLAALGAARADEEALAHLPGVVWRRRLPVARSLWRLGQRALRQRQLGRAQALLERASALTQVLLEPRDPRRLACVRDLGYAALRGGNPVRASRLLQAAYEGASGDAPYTPEGARLVRWLAEALDRAGDPVAAAPLPEQAIALAAQVHGTRHPAYAAALRGMGLHWLRQRELAWAERFLRHALKALEAGLGTGAPRLVETLGDLAACLREQGRALEARALFQDRIRRLRARFGPKHPVLEGLARAYGAHLEEEPRAA